MAPSPLPPPPTNLTATPGNSFATLTWTASAAPGAEYYNIYQSPDPNAPLSSYAEVGTTEGTTYTAEGLDDGTTYSFYVIPVNNAGAGAPSATATATIGLPRPTIVSAVPGNGSVTVTWNAEGGAGASTYNLYEGPSAGGPFTQIANVPSNSASTYSDTQYGLTNGSTYFYYVVALDNAGASPASAIVSAPVTLPAPTGLSTTASDGSVTLTWTASAAPGAAYYDVYESSDPNQLPGSFNLVGTTSGTSFTQMGLSTGFTYSYYLIPFNAGGAGIQSNTVFQAVGLPAPANLTATAGNGSVTLNWTASAPPGASYYQVYESSDPNQSPGSFSLIGNAYGTTFTQTGLSSGVTYSYYLIPYGNGAAGTQSATVSATPGLMPLMNLFVMAGNGSANLSWTAAPGAGSYTIYRSTDTVNYYNQATTGSTTWSQGVNNQVTYYYYVVANGGSSNGVQSNVASVLINLPPPTNLTATPGNGSITLSWTASTAPGAGSYTIYRSTDKVNYYNQATTGSTTWSQGVGNNATYYYYIVPNNNGGAGTPSAIVSAYVGLPPPTNLTAIAGNGSITLSWTPSASPGAGSYSIYRSTDNVNYYNQATTSSTSWSQGVDNNTTYYYYILPFNSGGSGTASSTIAVTPTLPAPTNLTATYGNGVVTLNWTASAYPGAGAYTIYRSTDDVNYYNQATTASTSWSQGVNNNTTYYYYLVPSNSGGSGTASSIVSVQPGLPPPTDLTATPGNGEVTLSWTASAYPGANSYTIYRSTDAVNYFNQASTSSTSWSQGVGNNTTYYYYIVPSNNGGSGDASPIVSTLVSLPAPSELTATMSSTGTVTLNWNPSGYPGASSYTVYESSDGVNYFNQATTSDTFWTQSGLNPSRTYYFYLIPNNNGGSGTQSTIVSTAVGIPPPTNLTATAGLNSITLNWTASFAPGATSYNIYESTDGVDFTYLDSTANTTYTQSNLSVEVTYYYYVVPVNGATTGTPSDTVSATPLLPVPAGPQNLQATAGDGTIALAWDPSVNADGYYIYESTTSGTSGFTQVASSNTPSATVSAQIGTTYYFYVTAYDDGGPSAPSNTISSSLAPLAAPGNLAAEPANGDVSLSWTAVTGADGYDVYESTDGTNFSEVGGSGGTSISIPVSLGTTYYFYVIAYNNGGFGPASNTITASADSGPSITNAGISPVTIAAGGETVTITATVIPTVAGASVTSVSAPISLGGSTVATVTLSNEGGGSAYIGNYTFGQNVSGSTYVYTATVIATDSLGVTTSGVTAGTTTQPSGTPPSITASIGPATLTAAGGPITVTATIADSSSITSATAAVSVNGGNIQTVTLSNGGSGSVFSGAYNAPVNSSQSPITYTATVSATDSLGLSATQPATGSSVEAVDQAPSIANATISPSTLTALGGNITISATVTDPSSGVSAVNAEIQQNSANFTSVPLSNGGSGNVYTGTFIVQQNSGSSAVTYTATVSATDGAGNGSTSPATGSTVQAADAAPVIANATISPSTLPNSGGTVTISATVTDATSGIQTVTATLYLNGSATPLSTTLTAGLGSTTYSGTINVGANTTSLPETYTASIVAVDLVGNQTSASATGNSVEAGDGGPVVSNAQISPANVPASGGTITVSANVVDTNNTLTSVVAQLQLDGVNGTALILSNGGSGSTYTGTYAAPANSTPFVQTYTATVTASDTGGLSMSQNTSGTSVVATNAGQPGELPNLEVTQAAVANQAIEGQQISISYTITNVGLGQTPNGWNDDIYLSQTPSLTAGAVLLGKFGDAQELAPGASYTQTKNVILPAGTFGPYYVVIVADGDDLLQEADRSDDSMAQPIAISQIQNLLAAPSQLSTLLEVGVQQTGSITLTNSSNNTVTGVAATITGGSPNISLSITPPTSLTAGQSVSVPVNVEALNATTQTVKPVVQFTDAQGDSSNVDLTLTVVPPYPQLTVTPGSINVGMVDGTQSNVSVTITNSGGAVANNLVVSIPTAASAFMSLASPQTIGSLAPGASATIQLLLTPAANLTLGTYTGGIAVNGDSVGTVISYSINAVSTATGSLQVVTSDEYTYFASTHPPLTGATVTLVNTATGATTLTGTTDSTGTFNASTVTAGAYQITVTAPNHADYSNSVQITPGEPTVVNAFLSAQLVTYDWTVVPVSTTDQYDITLQAVFQTNVPAPEVTVSPAYIDLTKVPFDSTGKAVVLVTYTNEGLIAANDLIVNPPSNAGYIVQIPQQDLGSIAAQSSIVVPVTFIQAGSIAASSLPQAAVAAKPAAAVQPADSTGAPCSFDMDANFSFVCGNININKTVTVSVSTGACAGLPAPNVPNYPGLGDGGTGGGGGGDGGGGGGTSYGAGPAPPSVTIPNLCNQCEAAILTDVGGCVIGFLPVSCVTSVIINGAQCAYGLASPGWGAYDGCFNGFLSSVTSCAKSLSPAGKAINIISCVNNALDLSDNCFGTHFFSSSVAAAMKSAAASHPADTSPAPTGLVDLLGTMATESGRLQDQLAPTLTFLGSSKWLSNSDADLPTFANFMTAFSTITQDDGSNPITPAQQTELENMPLPTQIGIADVDALVQRWNNTVAYYNAGILNSTQVPAGQSTNFIAQDTLGGAVQAAQTAAAADAADGYTNLGQGVQSSEQNVYDYILNPDNNQSGTCATVTIQLNQTVTLTRTNFLATLNLTNSNANVPLSNVAVNIVVTDVNGNDVTSEFGISTPTTSVFGGGGVNGSGTLGLGQTGTAQWTIEPTEAAGAKGAAQYFVGGLITYTQNGAQITVPLYPTGITVVPDPQLTFHYFLQRQVYGQDPTDLTEGIIDPIDPFYMGLLVDNSGAGTAHQLTITSDQPQIVDNEKGLDISFQLIGTQVNLQPVSPSLMVNLGDIAPGGTSAATFDMISSLAGEFISFSATYKHVDDIGNTDTSLIDGVDTHSLNHIVQIVDPSDDGKPDFLTTENANPNDLPDTVWDSVGAVEHPVTSVTDAISDGLVSNNNLTVHVAFPDTPTGFMYLQMNDPGQGNYALQSVVRSDGKQILVGPNAWTSEYEVHPITGGAMLQTLLYIFDDNAAGYTYTVTYAPVAPSITSISPVSIQAGSGSFTLTVTGTGFVSGATVLLNGQGLATTYVAATELTAVVPASAIASSGSLSVTVENPMNGSPASNSINLIVNPGPAKPIVAMTAPTGATVVAPAGIALAATASEDGGTIQSVTFSVNGQWVANGVETSPGVYTASIPSTAVGPYSLTAAATDTQGQTTTSAPINITAIAGGSSPAPTIAGLSPTSVSAGSAQFTLTVTGSNFVAGSLVEWSGQTLSTTYQSSTQLTAIVPATLVQQAGSAGITVVNPSLTGGGSAAAAFTIDAPALTPPTVSITSPANGGIFTAGNNITLNATAAATTPGASINSVSFYANGNLIGTATSAPYTVTFANPSAGSDTLTAVATDTDFSTATSAAVNITVNPLEVHSLRIASQTVLGGTSTTATVSISHIASVDETINVTSSDSNATIVGPVVVTAGQSTATFTIDTAGVATMDKPTITASFGGASASAYLEILPPDTVSGLTISPKSVLGGTSTTGTVTLAYAALTNQTITVTSTDSNATPVGPVVVAAGQTSATFTIDTSAVAANDKPVLTASLNGGSASAYVLILPPDTVTGLTISPKSVLGGTTSTGTVTLAYAPSTNQTVTVTSTDGNATAVGPVVVAAGQTSATFTIQTSAVSADDKPVLTASLNGSSKAAYVLVLPPDTVTGLTISPKAVVGGASTTGTVTLAYAALTDQTITVTSTDSKASVVGPVVVPAGQTSVDFTIDTSTVTTDDKPVIGVSLNGSTVSAYVLVEPSAAVSSAALLPDVMAGEFDTVDGCSV